MNCALRLAVINTAAENLADGVVENTEQMQEYGGLIRGQGRRLERLVDEVLLFTAGRFGLSGYELEPVEVAPIVSQSLSTSEASLHEAGFTVAKEIDDKLASHRGRSVRGHHLHRKFGEQRDEIFEFEQVDRDPCL